MTVPQEVDVIFAGAGAAGCVAAGRLARADPSLVIALIEHGPHTKDAPNVTTPGMYLSALVPDSKVASFHTCVESKHLGGRAPIVPSGQCVGGGSAINFLMYTRAAACDYDEWQTEGWSSSDLLPLLRKTETFEAEGDPELHGFEGPLKVSYGHVSKPGLEFIESAKDRGIPFQKDIQDLKTGHAVTQWAKWIGKESGKRSDVAHHHIYNQTDTNKNLHVLAESKVKRVIFEGEGETKKAIGIEYMPNKAFQPNAPQEVQTLRARKLVVVSGGAMGSPTILERSGIGAADKLGKAGIEQVVDLPGVGDQYQDHQLTLLPYRTTPDAETGDDLLRGNPEFVKEAQELYKDGKGIMATNFIDGGAKVRPTPQELEAMGPEFQEVWKRDFEQQTTRPVAFTGVVSSFLGDHSTVPPGRYFTVGGYLMIPASRGTIHVKSDDPYDVPEFDPGFLNHPADMAPNVWAYKLGREIARRMPGYRGEFAPGHPAFPAKSDARCRDMDAETAHATLPGAISVGVAPGGWVQSDSTLADSAPKGTEPNGHASVSDERSDKHLGTNGNSGSSKPVKELKDLVYSEEDDEAIREYMRQNVGTTWHSMGTCAMRPRKDGGVVDPRLNVYGTKGLKVADLSICPGNVCANTNSTAILVGEKAAMLIAEDLGIKMSVTDQ